MSVSSDSYFEENAVDSTGADLQCSDRTNKNKPLKDKTCLVCGDRALGYNFNAISCESCKAFFRRNAFKEIRGRCEGKCDITVESRSYCKKCRLKKCFDVGMKRDLILNEQQKNQRRLKIQENRLRRQGYPYSAVNDLGPGGSPSPSAAVPGSATTTTSSSSSSSSTAASCCAAAAASSGSLASSPPGKSPQDAASEASLLSVKSEPEALTHIIASVVDHSCLEDLRPVLREQVREVINAFEISFDGPMERQPIVNPSGTEFLNMADSSVRRLVKMAKHLSTFSKLEQVDQISLLKGAVVEVLILRSAKMFDAKTLGWFVNKGGQQHMVSAAALQFGNQDSNSFFHQYHRFATTLLQFTQQDNVVLMLMIVMTVLSPDRASEKNMNSVTAAQEEYAHILKEYIRAKYPEDELMFPRVLQKLADIRELNESHTRMLTHMKVEELEPLIVEIFDMSS